PATVAGWRRGATRPAGGGGGPARPGRRTSAFRSECPRTPPAPRFGTISKLQLTTSKEAPTANRQNPGQRRVPYAFLLMVECYLEFGYWNLGFARSVGSGRSTGRRLPRRRRRPGRGGRGGRRAGRRRRGGPAVRRAARSCRSSTGRRAA